MKHNYKTSSRLFQKFFIGLFAAWLLLPHLAYAQNSDNETDAEKHILAWKDAVKNAMIISNIEEHKANASYKFNACFLVDDSCVASSEAYRDEFKKITFYYAPGKLSVPINHVTFYLSLEDNSMPEAIMRFVYFGEDWLDFDKVAVLVDNEIVFEQTIPPEQIRKEATAMSQVYEIGDIKMTPHLDVIEKIAQGTDLAVRMSGKSRGSYLDKQMLYTMRLQAEEILTMYGVLNDALVKGGEE